MSSLLSENRHLFVIPYTHTCAHAHASMHVSFTYKHANAHNTHTCTCILQAPHPPPKKNNNMYTNVHLWDEVLEGVHDPWWLGFLVVGEDTSDHHHSSQHNAQVQLQAQNHVVVQYAISQYTPTLHCLTDKGLCCEHTTLLVHEHTSYTHTLSLSLCETLRSNKAITDLVQQFSALAPCHPPPPPQHNQQSNTQYGGIPKRPPLSV